MSKKKQINKVTDAKLNVLRQQKDASQNQVDRLQTQIASLQNQHKQEKRHRNTASEIESSYKKNKMTQFLKLNKTYSELKNIIKPTRGITFEYKLSGLKAALSKMREKIAQTDKDIFNRLNELKKQKNASKKANISKSIKKKCKQKITTRPKFSPLYSQMSNIGTTTFDAEWENVGFADGFIKISHKGRWYRKEIAQSRKYLNEIKHYYNFHNVPKLKIILDGSIIKRIENQEVLFYHIDFLGIAAPNFGFIKLNPFHLKKWMGYTKQYYKTNLAFVFHTHTLKKLCEYCDPNFPIIPVGELMINSGGSKTIHNSFLFPMKSDAGHSIVWESIEESKASYVFSLNSFAEENVQTLFDYISGDTPNKRWTLINSKYLQNNLNMKNRILHTDMSFWDDEIRQLSNRTAQTLHKGNAGGE